jgi:hypothetical protein
VTDAKRYRITAAKEFESQGAKKTAWVNLGSLWMHEDGKMSGVLETVPAGNWFDGRIHCFRADDTKTERKTEQTAPPRDAPDDEIPF